MARERALPERRNPLVEPKHTPQLEILVERRRLGQTELTVKAGQVGMSNATKPANLGMFDYAHLRVPLPKDLQESGIFAPQRRNQQYPEAYFLMRRSHDGFISATGMFKAAFPWASLDDEEVEKKYIKSLPDTDSEEIAGNVWIPPESALSLADEYAMRPWIVALLDPEPIAKGTHDPSKRISTPPRFSLSSSVSSTEATTLAPPSETTSSRRRTLRSASPQKAAPPTPSRKIATPRKSRRGRPAASAAVAPGLDSVQEPEAAPESSLGNEPGPESAAAQEDIGASLREAASAADDTEPETPNPAVSSPSDTVRVDIESVTEPAVNGGEPSTTTHVTVETPASHPDLKIPTDAQGYLDQAKAAIAEAHKMTSGRAAGKKRKATEAFVEDVEELTAGGGELNPVDSMLSPADTELVERPSKRARTTEMELRKEKIKKRATLGIAASLAVGAILPVVMGTFFSAL